MTHVQKPPASENSHGGDGRSSTTNYKNIPTIAADMADRHPRVSAANPTRIAVNARRRTHAPRVDFGTAR
jgi:hypothetical protein